MNGKQLNTIFFRAVAVITCIAIVSMPLVEVRGQLPDPLSADFYWVPLEPTDQQTVVFHDNSSGSPIVWIWDFGDGTTSTNQNPAHMYADNGTYLVRLTIWNITNVQSTITKTITVTNVPPVADAGGDFIANSQQVELNASNSYDTDGTIVYYYWDFGDGDTAVGQVRSHTYADDGAYDVTLNVTDNDGDHNETMINVIIDTVPPQTNATLNGTKGINNWYQGNVTVTFNRSDDRSGVDTTWYVLNGTIHPYSMPFEITEEGVTAISFYSIDNATNREDNNSLAVNIDNTPPETNVTLDGTLGNQGWYRGAVTATLVANDTLSGVDTIHYRVDDGDWEAYDGAVTVGSNGHHTLFYYAIDNVSNEGQERNITFKIDTEEPEVSLTAPDEGYIYLFGRELLPTILGRTKIIGGFTTTATASDGHSGIYSVFFNLDDDVLWEDYTPPYQTSLPRQLRGVHTLSVTAYDGAGNTATSVEVEYIKIL